VEAEALFLAYDQTRSHDEIELQIKLAGGE
jgi:hypothetical protein